MALRVAVLVVCCLLAVVGAASFVVTPGTSGPEPAEFDRTVAMGLTLAFAAGLLVLSVHFGWGAGLAGWGGPFGN